MIQRIFTQERVNAVIAALVLIGIALMIVSVWRYIDAAQQLEGNLSQQVANGALPLDVQTPDQADVLMIADVQRRRLEQQQNESLITAGIGLGSLAIGWLGYDIVRGRRRKSPPTSPHQSTAG